MTAVVIMTEEIPDKDQIRFLKYVQKEENGCWRWCGAKAITGYGNVFYRGTTWLAHRASYLIFGKAKSLTDGLQMAHSCNNRSCVNPDHLSEKTSKENNGADKRAHGVDQSGERCHLSKLTWESVREIRRRGNEGIKTKALAIDYGVSCSAISSILHNKTWKEIKDE